MFNEDVTKTYTYQDATLEILVMLAGAFLLGCLLCWLIRSLQRTNKDLNISQEGNNQYKASTRNSFDEQSHSSNDAIAPQALTSNNRDKSHNIDTKESHSYSTPKIDDLTKISGLTPKMESNLRNNGIKSFTDLRDIDKHTLTSALNLPKSDYAGKETQTWPHQASLAAKGEWKKLSEYQSFIQRTIATTKSINDKKEQNTDIDDLKKIEGIGPKIEEILNNENILTYKNLRKSDRDTLKGYLDKAGSRFDNHEPETWPLQAGMAERGEWEELKIYQEFMNDDTALFADSDSELNANAIKGSSIKSPSMLLDNVKKSTEHANKADDLKKVDGIGPKIQSILNKKNINTYKDLSKSNRDTLKSYLDEAGNQYKQHEPETWPHQASLADKGEWQALGEYQDEMHQEYKTSIETEKARKTNESTSLHIRDVSSSKPVNDKTSKVDNLKKIEGIGPKIEELLHKAGILTFENLRDCSSSTIKDLLDAAGPQFRMHNPDTWPHQAKMAVNGEWDKLKEYQDFLMGGRE